MRRRLLSVLLIAFTGTLFLVRPAFAAQTSEELFRQQKELHEEAERLEEERKAAEQEQKSAQNSLNRTNDSIREITGEREMVNEAIGDLNDDLVSLLATINMIEEEIEDTREQIVDTQAAYDEAKQSEEEQYAAMKARAKFMYEKGGQDMLTLFLQSESISEFLNRTTYVQELYDYDRRELESYIQAKNEADTLKNELLDAEAELQADLFELEQSQADMEQILAELEEQAENYSVMLAHAKQDAAAYQLKIKQQSSAIDKLATELQAKAAEEAEVKKAAEDAKKREDEEKKKAEEEKKKAEKEAAAAAAASDGQESDASQWVEEQDGEGSESEEPEEKEESSSGGKTYAAPGSATGSNIAAYACQFVGNPYVAGGTSLTNGCDCSGFTMSVYQAFGISIPRTSWSQQRVGTEVSLENARAGDIVCYAGHVGIYLGNGQIVHASTERTGIKYGNVNYKPIMTIRRLV